MSTTGLSTHNTNTGDTGRTTGFGNTFTGTGTGSWADSTHSVIWMSRDGKSQALPYLRRTRASQYASLLVAALLTLAAASNLIDVYGSATSWALAAIPATIIGSLVALAGTVPALRLWWQMLFMAVAQLVVGPVLFLNDTTIAHIVPTLRTLTRLDEHARIVQIHSVGRTSYRYRRWLFAGRMDHLPVVRATDRHFRSD